MDQIKITELEVYCNHGVFPEENVLGQKFLVTAALFTDTRKAGLEDNLTASIHYGDVSQFIEKFMKAHTYKLIETVAEQLAMALLLEVKNLKEIELEIQKPWAPVGLPLKTVSVKIRRGWHEVYLALGSNMGEKQAYLDQAVEALRAGKDTRVLKVSSYIETEPYGVTDQDVFLNGAVKISTLLTPEELLRRIHEIEAAAERKREIHWGPRTLDIDILFYDDLVLAQDNLIIPHVEIEKRTFVLEPLLELCPNKRHPVNQKTVAQLLEELS
ncbi:MAG: 2-amino-4-hydroxy-6-hydroxymethyldihydropteridine diphosphokinase [Hespellia sp.]|nr:2-amino-4-hydroxy-6-hydroxymethyldihydropteridine diphosphokinase [Hespellia sp.]